MSVREDPPSPAQQAPADPASPPMGPPATPSGRPRTQLHQDLGRRTPSRRSLTVPPRTPGHTSSRSSTAPLNTPGGRAIPHPATPRGTIKSCTSDPNEYTVVRVHTAKCTECDKRNMATMLRCPGCTFQICQPCREKREKESRNLEHGSMLSPGGLSLGARGSGVAGGLFNSGNGLGSATAKRRTLVGLTGSPAQDIKQDNGANEGDIDDSAALGREGKGKGKAPADPISTAKPASKKRTAKPKSKALLVDDSSNDEFDPELASPTASKRRRTTLGLTDSPTATSARPSRRMPASKSTPAYVEPSSPGSDMSVELRNSVGRRLTDLSPAELDGLFPLKAKDPESEAPPRSLSPQYTGRIQELLEQHGVNLPGNRYECHFLQRQIPVNAGSTMRGVPALIKNSTPQEKSDEQRKAEKNEAALERQREKAHLQTVRKLKQLENDQVNSHAAPAPTINNGSANQDKGPPKELSEQL